MARQERLPVWWEHILDEGTRALYQLEYAAPMMPRN